MTYQRRDFLKLTAALGAGIALGPLAGCSTASKVNINNNFGLQLYTLRDDLVTDPKAILTQVASFGYKEIESYEGPQGMFWGMGNTGFKKFMDDLGMKLVSSHCDINQNFEQKASEAAAIGMRYLISPYIGPQKSLDDYKRIADTFNQRGEICKRNGIRFAYHNHDYSFIPLNGQMPQDVLMQNTDKNLIDFELDIYWVVNAGQDPEAWLKKYTDRFRLVHVKDRQKGVGPTAENVSVVLGTGSINFPQILKTAAANGVQHYMVEQEAYVGTTPLTATKENAEYMKKFRAA